MLQFSSNGPKLCNWAIKPDYLKKLSRLNNSICPFLALEKCLQVVPGGRNDPLFQFQLYGKWFPLTDNRVRRHLKDLLPLVGKHQSYITFHSFRRSGATFAFNHNVPLQDIQGMAPGCLRLCGGMLLIALTWAVRWLTPLPLSSHSFGGWGIFF